MIKERQQKQLIQIRTSNERITTDPKEIGARAEELYGNLFSSSPIHLDVSLFEHVNATVTDIDNHDFCAIPSPNEVFQAIQIINPTISPGNDGFTGYFYRVCWNII